MIENIETDHVHNFHIGFNVEDNGEIVFRSECSCRITLLNIDGKNYERLPDGTLLEFDDNGDYI